MEKKELKVELKPDVATGSYSNLAVITHSQTEFVLDFAAMLPALQKAVVTNRIIMAPEHAKRLLAALQDNIIKYENTHGQNGATEPKATFHMRGFGGNNGAIS